MRTTVDLPPAVHRRARELAESRGQSLSATIAELTIRGLGQLDEPVQIDVDPRSGFPVMSFGRHITPEDVAAALDDE
jgi:predicted transcriptional regulator